MRKYLLHAIITLSVFTMTPIIKAEEGRGIGVVIIDRKGKEAGIYKGSHALVIGVSDYKAGWSDLESVSKEIDKVKDALSKQVLTSSQRRPLAPLRPVTTS